ASGATVDFGSVRANGIKVVDANTITCIVPAPSSVNTGTSATYVGVKVTSGSAVTLSNGYGYAPANDSFAGPATIIATIPADGATGVARNLRTTVYVLSERAASSSVGSTTNFDWSGNPTQDISSARVASVTLGPGGRVFAMRRN